MGISLNKGANISLSKTDPTLNNVIVGLGWDARPTAGVDFDLDASAFMVKEDGKVRADSDFIFYNQTKSTCGSVEHTGDNRTGAGDGDDEALDAAEPEPEQAVDRPKHGIACRFAHAPGNKLDEGVGDQKQDCER